MGICEQSYRTHDLFRLWWIPDAGIAFPVSVHARTGNAIACSGEIMKTSNIEPHPYGLHRNRHSERHAIIRGAGMLTESRMLICLIESDGRFMTQESNFSAMRQMSSASGTRHPFASSSPTYDSLWFPVITRIAGIRIFCWQCGRSHVHPTGIPGSQD